MAKREATSMEDNIKSKVLKLNDDFELPKNKIYDQSTTDNMETEMMYDFVLDEFMIKLTTKKKNDTTSSITIGEIEAYILLDFHLDYIDPIQLI